MDIVTLRRNAREQIEQRVAIVSYQGIIRWLGEGDPTTRRLMEDIVAVEEEHADDTLSLLKRTDSK